MKSKSPNPVDIAIGTRVRSMRIAAGMSQEKLADACGITFQQVQKYEKGTNRISGSRLTEIAAALGCRPADFFGDDGPGAGTILDGLAGLNTSDIRIARLVHGLPAHARDGIVRIIEAAAATFAGGDPVPVHLRRSDINGTGPQMSAGR